MDKFGRQIRSSQKWSRRDFLKILIAASGVLNCSLWLSGCGVKSPNAETFIGKGANYNEELSSLIRAGFRELKINALEIKGKRILLKPNLVEPRRGAIHIITQPAVVQSAAEAFLSLGASRVIVGEGSGHCRDTHLILEESGFDNIFRDKRITFVDLNYDEFWVAPNVVRTANLKSFVFPQTLKQVDWIVSMPKLKTHHWAGVTLSMKNLFGAMPGIFYGWPKNVLHMIGITEAIIDINSTLRPHFAIVDGIVGMEGDGPIMGNPKEAGVIVMGRNLSAVDATCCRLMGVNPDKIRHLSKASGKLGPIKERFIQQRGEDWRSLRTDFLLLNNIEAHRGLRIRK
ncbi:MAG TPA: DUF362 domain-containing protein [Thermodesulfobacteriota bacterium]|nr:DUF362 domain-containing protein [Thermodesulfobacteriota bacterium]